MRTNKAKGNAAAHSAVGLVHIEFIHSNATAISIAGTFNDWQHEATPMVHLGDGRWFKELLLPPGVYEYQLVVNGKWMPDPKTVQTAPNPFGKVNSILRVTERPN